MRWLSGIVLFLAMITGSSIDTRDAHAQACPAALQHALRLVLVTGNDPNAPQALIETFERASPAEIWRSVGGMRQAVIGAKGVAWGAGYRHLARAGEPLKQEGDKRSPMGIYAFGAPFGADAQNLPGYMQLEKGRHLCIEEPKSRSYGRIVDKTVVEPGVKYDEMAAEKLYRRGVVVDYPADAANKAGSCIFIHIWRQPGKGTAGCVALDEQSVADLRSWVSEQPSAIAILTPAAKQHFAACLP
jgi:D-alanyl-D-alanine dipeptidase